MSGPEPPHTEARISSGNHRTFPPKSPPRTERALRLSGPPQAPPLVTPDKVSPKAPDIQRDCIYPIQKKSASNAHTIKLKENHSPANNKYRKVKDKQVQRSKHAEKPAYTVIYCKYRFKLSPCLANRQQKRPETPGPFI